MKFFKFNASGNDFVFFLASKAESKDASKYDFSELAKSLFFVQKTGFIGIIQ